MITGIFRAAAARVSTANQPKLPASELRAILLTCTVLLWVGPVLGLILLMLPSSAQAAEPLRLVLEVSPVLAFVAWALSTFSGITALLVRVDRELSDAPDKTPPRWAIFCAAHMFGSWLAGTLAFVGLQQQRTVDVWLILGSVILSSFGGAKGVEWLAEKYYKGAALPPGAPQPGAQP